MGKYIIGIDLGGTKIATAVADSKGNILKQINIPTLADKGADIVIDRVISSVDKILEESGINIKDVASLGIGVPGHVDAQKGIITKAPNLPGFENIEIRKKLKKHFPIEIIIDNDANAATIGEFKLGAGKNKQNMLFITVSTGIGGGLVIGGNIYHGSSNNAGEIGHMILDPKGPKCNCGNRGCLEAFASGPAMAKRAIKKLSNESKIREEASILVNMVDGDVEKITSKEISIAASEGDKFSMEIIKENAEYIGIGLVNIINVIDPEVIVLGGGVSMIGKPLFKAIKKTMENYSSINKNNLPDVIPAELGYDAGIIGAIALGLL